MEDANKKTIEIVGQHEVDSIKAEERFRSPTRADAPPAVNNYPPQAPPPSQEVKK